MSVSASTRGGAWLGLVAIGLATLVLPTGWDFLFGTWSGYSRGHEWMLVMVAAWLLWRQREALSALPDAPPRTAVALLLGLVLAAYVFGRSQMLLRVELLALIALAASLLLLFKGWAGLRLCWFALFLMLFIVPLPYGLSLALTAPLKTAVSAVATTLMQWVGYPIGRSGVVITIGQYQLLVAEACAGLHTMFSLEAMGLLYANLMNYRSWVRNGLLAVLVVPVSFAANVVRVVVLAGVTYHFGDAAGQGFIHGAAGLVLYGAALAMLGGIDRLLGRLLPARLAQ